jgi:hypothetical protein
MNAEQGLISSSIQNIFSNLENEEVFIYRGLESIKSF